MVPVDSDGRIHLSSGSPDTASKPSTEFISITRKLEGLELTVDQCKQVHQAYKTYLLGDAPLKTLDKKNDFQSFYNELNQIFNFSENEIKYLIQSGTFATFYVTTIVMAKNECDIRLLDELFTSEMAVDGAPLITYIKERYGED